jgi:RNA polymerase sigma-70 factor (ECF subfamily)
VSAPSEASRHLNKALDGDAESVRALIAALTPVIQARAARALARRGNDRARDARQELADLVQDIWLLLFRDDGRILRAWREDGGLSLANYVGLVAQREVARIARSGRRSPWALDPAEESDLERAAAPIASAEPAVSSRDLIDRLYERLEDELHEDALRLFRLIVVEELETAEVCAMTGLSSDAVYTWRSRLLRRARNLLVELARSPDSARTRPIPERSDTP